jgi:hypothetical protein
MADVGERSYTLGRLILDYVRAFMWPAIIILLVMMYTEDIRRILSERDVNIAGVVHIGAKVQEIESRTRAEIADVRTLVEEQRSRGASGEIASDIDTKLQNLELNLSREIAQVQGIPQQGQAAVQAPPTPAPTSEPLERAERAAAAERRGFESLVRRDVAQALAAFDEAYTVWPEYHNVAEIRRLLGEWRDRLASPDSDAWPQLYRNILTRYSWGLPADLRPAFRQETAKAY